MMNLYSPGADQSTFCLTRGTLDALCMVDARVWGKLILVWTRILGLIPPWHLRAVVKSRESDNSKWRVQVLEKQSLRRLGDPSQDKCARWMVLVRVRNGGQDVCWWGQHTSNSLISSWPLHMGWRDELCAYLCVCECLLIMCDHMYPWVIRVLDVQRCVLRLTRALVNTQMTLHRGCLHMLDILYLLADASCGLQGLNMFMRAWIATRKMCCDHNCAYLCAHLSIIIYEEASRYMI